MNPKTLPIYELRNDLVAALKTDSRIIIEAPTGSGKSTQVPQMLLDSGLCGAGFPACPSAQTGMSAPRDGDIVVLQPRRLAARL
ncbi:MAG TPA: hypothetical protein PLD51_08295, partial [Pontiellaceae bacterium]|nr:hypothetical protein [Pontiellaceae bacterium]